MTMSKQSVFDKLMTCTVPINGSAANAVSQKGCSIDNTLTPQEQMNNCKAALRRLESIVQGMERHHPRRKLVIAKLEEVKEQKAQLLEAYPRQLRSKNNKFDKILINELKMRLSDCKYQAAYRQAEKLFYGETTDE